MYMDKFIFLFFT